jgi:hypothetical protein
MQDFAYLRIVVEKRLAGPAWALLDEQGNLIIVEDARFDESEQIYVFLPPQAVRALRNLLNSPQAVQLIKQP